MLNFCFSDVKYANFFFFNFEALVSKLESHRITKDGEGICCPSLTYHLSRNIYFLNIIISPSGLPW